MKQTMGDNAYLSGTLSGTTATQKVGLCPMPCSITLKSADATRKIEFSTDGGVEFFTPAYDVVSATMIVVAANAPITHVKFTGVANDTWSIL